MAVLSCAVIGWVDLVAPRLRSRWILNTQNKHGVDHGITWRVLLKFCSELLTQWYVYFFAALNVRSAFTAPQDYILGTCHVCMFWFRMSNIRDNRQASKEERFFETGREINKDIAVPKRLPQIPIVREDCQIVRSAFHRLACVAGVFRARSISPSPFPFLAPATQAIHRFKR